MGGACTLFPLGGARIAHSGAGAQFQPVLMGGARKRIQADGWSLHGPPVLMGGARIAHSG